MTVLSLIASSAACGAPAPSHTEGAAAAARDAATAPSASASAAGLAASEAAHALAVMRECGLGWLASNADRLTVAMATGLDAVGAQAARCAAYASSCAGFTWCMTGAHGASGAPDGGRCDGDVVVASVQHIPVALDCAVWGRGATCRMGPQGARCEPRAGCADGGTLAYCAGAVAVDCGNPDFAALDCGMLEPGATCAMVGGRAVCVPGGRPTCTPGSGPSCVRDTLIACAPRSPVFTPLAQLVNNASGAFYEYRTDCAALGMACSPTLGTCAPRDTACSGLVDGACAGSVLQVCVGGALEQVPCGAVGARSCQSASCVP